MAIELHGKAKEDFTEWARKNSCLHVLEKYRVIDTAIIIWWMDIQNIIIQVIPQLSTTVCYVKDHAALEEVRIERKGAKNRLGCTEEAIKLANDIYNNRLK